MEPFVVVAVAVDDVVAAAAMADSLHLFASCKFKKHE